MRWRGLEGEVRRALEGEVRWRGLGQLKVDKLGDDVVRWGCFREVEGEGGLDQGVG